MWRIAFTIIFSINATAFSEANEKLACRPSVEILPSASQAISPGFASAQSAGGYSCMSATKNASGLARRFFSATLSNSEGSNSSPLGHHLRTSVAHSVTTFSGADEWRGSLSARRPQLTAPQTAATGRPSRTRAGVPPTSSSLTSTGFSQPGATATRRNDNLAAGGRDPSIWHSMGDSIRTENSPESMYSGST